MRLLLDSHVLVWWMEGDPRLTTVRDSVLEAAAVYVSAATVWELSVREAAGQLRLPAPILTALEPNHFDPLPITGEHAVAAARLPKHHADPFDRMLVAQADVERLVLVTHDPRLLAYGGRVLNV